EAPEASFTVTGTTDKEALKFNGSASKDPDGAIEKYTWEFGDGEKSEGAAAEVPHTYAKAGLYAATLTVEDSSKRTAKATKEVNVIDAPSVTTEPATGVGQTVATLNAKVNPNGAEVTQCVLEYGEAK